MHEHELLPTHAVTLDGRWNSSQNKKKGKKDGRWNSAAEWCRRPSPAPVTLEMPVLGESGYISDVATERKKGMTPTMLCLREKKKTKTQL